MNIPITSVYTALNRLNFCLTCIEVGLNTSSYFPQTRQYSKFIRLGLGTIQITTTLALGIIAISGIFISNDTRIQYAGFVIEKVSAQYWSHGLANCFRALVEDSSHQFDISVLLLIYDLFFKSFSYRQIIPNLSSSIPQFYNKSLFA